MKEATAQNGDQASWVAWRPHRHRAVLAAALTLLLAWIAFLAWMMLRQ